MDRWIRLYVASTLLILGIYSCSPRTGSFRRRNTSPLIKKQHVPNQPETTVCGKMRGKIESMEEQRFKSEMARVSTSREISFKDEEGTQEDHFMSLRCATSLKTLGMVYFVKFGKIDKSTLHVLEAWDPGKYRRNMPIRHEYDSLHFEGRSVDVTIAFKGRRRPKEKERRMGLLARMAYNSGFDWVEYASRNHIHASCKKVRKGGKSVPFKCFPGNSSVRTPDGLKPMSDLQTGDRVLSMDGQGRSVYSPVLLFLDYQPTVVSDFVRVSIGPNESPLFLSPFHRIYRSLSAASGPPSLSDSVFAKDLQTGQYIWHQTQLKRVIGLERQPAKGAFAPLTAEGNLFVNDILVSCYAAANSERVAHLSMAPARWLSFWMASGATGVHWYASLLHDVANWLDSWLRLYLLASL